MTVHQSDLFPVAVAKAMTSSRFVFPAIWHVCLGLTSPFRKQVQDIFDHGNNAPTLLIVPGFTHTSLDLEEAGKVFAEKYNVAFAPNLPWYSEKISLLADRVREKSQILLRKQEKNGELILLGHSLGGVVGVHATLPLQKSREKKIKPTVSSLYTIGSPHGGVPWAGNIPFIPVLREIAHPDLLYPTLEQKLSLPVTAITLWWDSLVPPESQGSNFLKKVYTNRRDHLLSDMDHLAPLEIAGAKYLLKKI